MTVKAFLVIAIVALINTSKASAALEPQITAHLSPNRATLTAAAGKNCEEFIAKSGANSLKNNFAAFKDFGISWSGPGKLEVSYIAIKIQSPEIVGGEYSQYIESEQLKFDGLLKAGGKFSSPCGVRFGNLELVNPKKATSLKGTLTLIGSQSSPANSDELIETEIPFELQYSGQVR